MPDNRLRRHPRFEAQGKVRVAWTPSSGDANYLVCSVQDISESGMRVVSTESMKVGQYVNFQADFAGINGSALVRSCRRGGMKHEIGMEFGPGVKWKVVSEAKPLAYR
jgi:hypothetical protein